MSRIERLAQTLQEVLGEKALEVLVDRGEVTLRVSAADYPVVAELLRDHPDLAFEQLIDLSGLDYSGYGKIYRLFEVTAVFIDLKTNYIF